MGLKYTKYLKLNSELLFIGIGINKIPYLILLLDFSILLLIYLLIRGIALFIDLNRLFNSAKFIGFINFLCFIALFDLSNILVRLTV